MKMAAPSYLPATGVTGQPQAPSIIDGCPRKDWRVAKALVAVMMRHDGLLMLPSGEMLVSGCQDPREPAVDSFLA